ncbi:MAG: nicotinamide-nucleotide amidase [Paracoccaceae bacterium]
MTGRAAELLRLAQVRGVRVATAESCTGGMLSAALTDLPGASAIFDRGFVVYSNAAKHTMLGVSEDSLRDFGAVSEEVATQMAEGALRRSDADIGLAVTGISGPGGSDFKPEGRVCFACAQIGKPTVSTTVDFGARGRGAVRLAAVSMAQDILIDTLRDASHGHDQP